MRPPYFKLAPVKRLAVQAERTPELIAFESVEYWGSAMDKPLTFEDVIRTAQQLEKQNVWLQTCRYCGSEDYPNHKAYCIAYRIAAMETQQERSPKNE